MKSAYWRSEVGIFLGIWLALIVGGRTQLFRDPGTLWHSVVGERILSTGQLVRVDPFSFQAAGERWIAMQWLGESFMALVRRAAGFDGLLIAAASILAFLFTWGAHRLLRAGCHWLSVVLLTSLAIAASSYHFHVRPHLATMLLTGATMAWILDIDAGRKSLRQLAWMAPLFILWTNLHAGVLGGIAMLILAAGAWILGGLLRWRGPVQGIRDAAILSAIVIACGLSVWVNPYGTELPRVWLMLNNSQLLPTIIEEHAPLQWRDPRNLPIILFAVVYLGTMAAVPLRRQRLCWLIPLAWLFLAISKIRHAPLFAISAVFTLAEMLPASRLIQWLDSPDGVFFVPKDQQTGERPLSRLAIFLPAALVIVAFGLSAIAFRNSDVRWATPSPETAPLELLPRINEYAERHPDGTPIFNDMAFGGFLIYYAPRLRVFIDDRCELYGEDRLARYAIDAHRHPEIIEQWQQHYRFRIALVRADSPIAKYLSGSPRWKETARTQYAVLFEETRQ